MYAYVLPTYMYVHHLSAWYLRRSEERVLNPLELELKMGLSYHGVPKAKPVSVEEY